jgi:hypothetical protein
MTPESTMRPERATALNVIRSSTISATRKTSSVPNPRAVSPLSSSMSPGDSLPPDPTTK